jgi:DNA-binding CsgD family transcriptional regulator
MFSPEFVDIDVAKLFTHLPHSILLKNSSLNFVAANKKAGELMGFKNPSEMIGLNDSQLNCPAAALHEEINKQDRSVLKDNSQSFLDIGYYSAKGDLKILYTSKIKIMDEKSRSFVLVSTTEIPMVAINNTLFSLMNSVKKKGGVHSYQLKTNINTFKLTDKQAECLFYLLRGKGIKEIALILKRSPRTIEDHLSLLKQKFNCLTKSQLIEKAFQLGFGQTIPPSLFSL